VQGEEMRWDELGKPLLERLGEWGMVTFWYGSASQAILRASLLLEMHKCKVLSHPPFILKAVIQ